MSYPASAWFYGVPAGATEGHNLYASASQPWTRWPFGPSPYQWFDGRLIDGGLSPEDATQGAATVHHTSGWTALAIVDMSGDERRGSNSTFAAEGLYSFPEMRAVAHLYFPREMARIEAAGDVRLSE